MNVIGWRYKTFYNKVNDETLYFFLEKEQVHKINSIDNVDILLD